MTTRSRAAEEPILGAQTVTRALAVLGVLRRASGDIGVTEIARELSLHASSTHRILKALMAEGYVSQNPETDRYRLGRESFLLGLAAQRNLGFSAVTPVLERLRNETGESANVVVRDGDHGLVVVRVESHYPLRYTQDVGTRLPLYCTSTGKALLAFSADLKAEVERIGRLVALTSRTITSKKALLRELDDVRRRGYSVNRGERNPGVCGVAAPILDPAGGVATAAVAVQGPTVRIPEERTETLGGTVVDAAAEIAKVLPPGFQI